MQLTLVVFLAAAVFSVQFSLCFTTTKTLLRLIPVMVILASMAVCGIVYVAAEDVYGAAFAAVIYAVVLAILLAVDGLAWLVAFLLTHKK